MDLYIDSDRIDAAVNTIGEALEVAQGRLEGRGRVVVEVRLDGISIDGGELDKRRDEALRIEELQLVSADPFELTLGTLRDVKEVLEETREIQTQAAECFQTDNTNKALSHVRDVLATWQQVQQSVAYSARLIQLPLDQVKVGERTAAQIIQQLAQLLGELHGQLTSADWIGLADTLAYPLNEALDDWAALIDALCSRIEEAKNGTG